ncbi:MAG: glycosyltransferase family 4 protein, partial [Actinomycetota bacterium]
AEIFAGIDGIGRLSADLGNEGATAGGIAGLRGRAVEAVRAGRSVVGLWRLIRREGIEILHTSDRPRDALITVLLGRLTGARSIVHVHVLFLPWMGRALQWAIRSADARIAVSAFVADSLTGAGLEPTHVVLNAIETDRWTPGEGREDARAELGIEPEAPTVVTACRLFPEKGVAELITAMAEVCQTVPEARLVVVGRDTSSDGSYRRSLDELVAASGLTDNVIFTGQRSDVPRLMAAGDVFAMPSFEEPFGLVFAEAMAMELPVVALDNGGTREIVVNGETGLLSQPGDHEALVDHLRSLLVDPERRAKLGAAGRHHVLTRFDVSRMAEDTSAVYRQVLADPTAVAVGSGSERGTQ